MKETPREDAEEDQVIAKKEVLAKLKAKKIADEAIKVRQL